MCFFKVLAEKVHVRALSIAQRVKLLQQGLNDRSGKRSSFLNILIQMFDRILSDVVGFIYVEAVMIVIRSSKGAVRCQEMFKCKKFYFTAFWFPVL